MMRPCTEREALDAIAAAHWPAPEYSFGKRYTQVRYVFCGRLVAQRDDQLKRGKVVSKAWMCDPEVCA